MSKLSPFLLAICLVATACASTAFASAAQQPVLDDAAQNTQKAHAALDAMVKALGGDAWLQMKNRVLVGRSAAFFRGKPSGGTTDYWDFTAWPDQERFEYTKHRDVVQIFTGRVGWEIIYSGKHPLPPEQVEDYMRRRDHSIEIVVKQWLRDPATIVLYDGQRLAERHLADEVTVISPANESVTIQMDADTHLPLRRIFQWRDPVYKDKDEDIEEYDNYRIADGFQTPFNITRFRNGEMTLQRYILRAMYNQPLPPDEFSVDATVARIVQK